jgi:hypothetical protein
MYSPLPAPLIPQINEISLPVNSSLDGPTSLIELAPPTENRSATPPILPNQNKPLDFVDTVVTNFFSVAKQAGSTAKAIFNTLQAFDEVYKKQIIYSIKLYSFHFSQVYL